jgi:hypothetical protein
MESRVATQFGDDMIAVLSVISERNPPAASAAERQFLRDAIAMADQAEIMAGRRDRETPC